MSGAVITETVFGRPGLGRLAVQGILQKDFPLVQGFVLFVAVSYVLANLLVDLCYAVLDHGLDWVESCGDKTIPGGVEFGPHG